MGRNLIVAAVLLAGVVALLLPLVARVRQATTPKRILVLYWYNRGWSSTSSFEENFLAVVNSASVGSVEYYAEFMEIDRFPGDDQAAVLREYLRQKYARVPIDVLVAVSDASLQFLLKHRDELFPHVPIVFSAVKPPTAKEMSAGAGLTGFIHDFHYKETLELALRLQPDTEHVFVVSGTLERNKQYEEMGQAELEPYKDRVSITYLTDLSPKELASRMNSLPGRSIVLYVWQQAYDEQNNLLESRDILSLIVNSTRAPIYGMATWQVGRGIVGGYVRGVNNNGDRAAEIALRIANGARAQDFAIQRTSGLPVFDWRELNRLGISEALLPPGSIVNYRAPSFWEEYKGRAIAVISLIIFQSLLITGLIITRARRRRTQEALRESEVRFRNMANSSPVMVWVTEPDGSCSFLSQSWYDFTGQTPETGLGFGWLNATHPDDQYYVHEMFVAANARREAFRFEYRLRGKDGSYAWAIDAAAPRVSDSGEFLGYIGSVIDITERKTAEQALENLSGQLIQVREDECARIARELHDDLSQSVALISLELDQLGQNPPGSQAEFHKLIREILEQAADLSGRIHQMSHDLHPSKLAQLGLVTALMSLCADLSKSYKLSIEFMHDDVPKRLPKDVSLCLYRIVQESLNNVVRHSGAKEARVELRRTEEEIQMRVTDLGRGFDVDSARSRKGLGLISMRERLRLVGGTVSIYSSIAGGTRIEASVPLGRRVVEREGVLPGEKKRASASG
ncbi:MAG TPA: ABC transporter substrate binding protein [Blastocatellia bacterium]|nr:ABC transporter substrate binding protein [Blastocatellia bacterium]